MAAPLENQFWKIRSRHGCEKLFKTPQLLWEAACEYFEWCDEHPFKEQQLKVVSIGDNQGSSVEKVEVDKMRPYTIQGLCLYFGANVDYWKAFRRNLRPDHPDDKDFCPVVKQVDEIIYNQKFSGAASGFFNSGIIARDLGLVDKTQSDTTLKVEQPLFPDIKTEEEKSE